MEINIFWLYNYNSSGWKNQEIIVVYLYKKNDQRLYNIYFKAWVKEEWINNINGRLVSRTRKGKKDGMIKLNMVIKKRKKQHLRNKKYCIIGGTQIQMQFGLVHA